MHNRTNDIAYIALFTALLAVCSWVSIPTAVPFTLQTFAVFAAIGLLGAKRATISIVAYILLGAAGVPVFAGFSAGFSALFGLTGGYLFGFLAAPAVYALITRFFGEKPTVKLLAMAAGLVVCYLFGTVWFTILYSRSNPITFIRSLTLCVFPFVLPDLVKISVAVLFTERFKKYIKVS